MSVTLQDIANACGVSRGTVDRALNNKGRISEKTKAKILEAAEEKGYKPNLVARSLVKGRSMCIGIIVLDILNHYFAQIVNAVSKEAKLHGYAVDVMLHETEPELERKIIDNLVARRIDGLIICPVNDSKEFLYYVQKLTIPVITVGTPLLGVPNISIDEYKAAFEATELILRHGYERLAFVCPTLSYCDFSNELSQDAHRRRLGGFREAADKAPGVEYEIFGSWDYVEKTEEYLRASAKKTAFLCSGDIFALEIMRRMNEYGKTPPVDFGIMGFDNIDTLRYVRPALTTIDIPENQYGTLAVQSLINRIEGKPYPQKVTADYVIVERDTL